MRPILRTTNIRNIISTGSFGGTSYNIVRNINIPEQIQKLDSVHDFGGSRGNNLATDSLSKKKNTNNNNYSYNQMTLSFIQNYSFTNIIPSIEIQNFSSFSYPGCAPIQRSVDDVENCCLLGAMQESLTAQGGMTYNINYMYCNVNLNDTDYLKETKRRIALFFDNYTDNEINGTNKINFIVDTPGDITKILKSTRETDNFAYILTQESAHDSAKGKPTPLEPLILNQAYRGNGYVEAFQGSNDANNQLLQNALLAQVNRTYTNPQFESNFDINFTGMSFEVNNTRSVFSTNVTYRKPNFNRKIICNLNSLIHPTNVPQITKEVKRIIEDSNLILQPITQSHLEGNNMIGIDKFYDNFNTYGNGTYYANNPNANNLDFNFTKKRAGDGLQAKIVQLLNSENYAGLPCYKMGNGKGSCNNDKLFYIRKAVLVTIDRVLFSYCIKNRIPAIYSGTNCILLFNPIINTEVVFTGGTLLSLSLPLSEIKPKYTTNERLTPFNRNVQIGGSPETEIVYDIMDIPFCIFKLMPRILYERLNPAGWAILRSKYSKLSDNDVITHYGNRRSCIFYRDYPFRENNEKDIKDYNFIFTEGNGYNAVNENYVIWFDDIFNVYKRDKNNEITFHIETIYLSLKYLPEIKYTKNTATFGVDEILKIITALPVYFTRLQRQIKSEGLNLNVDAVRTFLLEDTQESYLDHPNTYFGGRHHGGAKYDDNNSLVKLIIPNNPKLNVFLNFFYNNDISLDKDKLATNNFLALASYLSIFDRYEINMSFDNDKYEQDFIKISETLPEVSNKISMYLFFKFLLEDFPEQHDKICYGLMEYFINEGDDNNNYFAIADDLQTQIYYIYCGEIVRPYYVNEIIEQNISDGTINVEDPIFINTKTYFKELYNRINEKNLEVSAYLNEPARQDNIEGNIELEEYIKTYFNMYGFMNMTNDFMDSIFEPESEAIKENDDTNAIAKGIPGLSTQERIQRIEEQQSRFASTPLKSTAVPKSSLTPFDPSKQKTALDVSTFSNGDTSNMVTSNLSTNIGRGGKTKKCRKEQTKRKTNKKRNKKHNKKHNKRRTTIKNRKNKYNKNTKRFKKQ